MKLFDLHCDTLYECVVQGQELYANTLHLDLVRGHRYAPWAQVFAVWTPDTLRGEAAWAACLRVLRFAQEQEERFPDSFSVIRDLAGLDAAFEKGACAGILGLESGAPLNGSLEYLDRCAAEGVRVITLTWNGENELGGGSGCDPEAGLTSFGREAVRRMEKRGIVPDVSHLNRRGFWDTAEQAEGPFIASHSVFSSVHPHPRNLGDEQFREIVRRGGLVGLNLCRDQLGTPVGESTFDCLRRHLEHGWELGGENTLAIGCDLDGTQLPPEWGGISVMEALYRYLLSKNYEESLLERLFFGNSYDFFRIALTRGAPIE